MTSPQMPPRRAREHRTAPRTPAHDPDGHVDGQDTPDASTARLRVLAEAHAHEADRLAHTTAGITHALLAHFWQDLAKETR